MQNRARSVTNNHFRLTTEFLICMRTQIGELLKMHHSGMTLVTFRVSRPKWILVGLGLGLRFLLSLSSPLFCVLDLQNKKRKLFPLYHISNSKVKTLQEARNPPWLTLNESVCGYRGVYGLGWGSPKNWKRRRNESLRNPSGWSQMSWIHSRNPSWSPSCCLK